MFNWLRNAFRLDGIQDDELPPGSDWMWLTPMERIGVQSNWDAECAIKLIEERKAKYSTYQEWRRNETS